MPPTQEPAAFQALHPLVQRWIWQQGWTDLRDAQEAACQPILDGTEDVLLAAATASGKTEAAFLPICSRIAGQREPSFQALYVSPLKALINDQFLRLEDLCRELEIPVHRWHGDVSGARKQKALQEPGGLLLITPEALEALFVLRGPEVRRAFASLRYCVVDELHSFLGTARGRQLQSLLHRLETLRGCHVPRIGLSATLGDMGQAAAFLRPPEGRGVRLLLSSGAAQELKVQIRGYQGHPEAAADDQVARDLFRLLRGSDNLVFCNRRQEVEQYADLLAGQCRQAAVPEEFWPHHGSLSREVREEVEGRLRDRSAPVNVICTATLEMGIDVGQVRSVAQIGPPPSVASLRQRLGRSGRRGEPAILRTFLSEASAEESVGLDLGLRLDLVQSIAMLELLLARWCESPRAGAMHLSTLIQQVLSTIAERSGLRAMEGWKLLCRDGPFPLSQGDFGNLLRALGQKDLLVQSAEGLLLLGTRGERLVNHYSFYSAFPADEEYRVTSGGRLLGTLPVKSSLRVGMTLILAGRRWEVLSIDSRAKALEVAPASSGVVPRFGGGGPLVHDTVRRTMRDVYLSEDVPGYLDRGARELLAEGRARFLELGLDFRPLVAHGSTAVLFPWLGDHALDTMALQLCERGRRASREGATVRVEGSSLAEVAEDVEILAAQGAVREEVLASTVGNLEQDKHDEFLPPDLAARNHASRSLDGQAAHLGWVAIQRRIELWGVPQE